MFIFSHFSRVDFIYVVLEIKRQRFVYFLLGWELQLFIIAEILQLRGQRNFFVFRSLLRQSYYQIWFSTESWMGSTEVDTVVFPIKLRFVFSRVRDFSAEENVLTRKAVMRTLFANCHKASSKIAFNFSQSRGKTTFFDIHST